MSRYFIDTFDGETWIRDEAGIKCADHEEAKGHMRLCPTSQR